VVTHSSTSHYLLCIALSCILYKSGSLGYLLPPLLTTYSTSHCYIVQYDTDHTALWCHCYIVQYDTDHTALWCHCYIVQCDTDHTALWCHCYIVQCDADHRAMWCHCYIVQCDTDHTALCCLIRLYIQYCQHSVIPIVICCLHWQSIILFDLWHIHKSVLFFSFTILNLIGRLPSWVARLKMANLCWRDIKHEQNKQTRHRDCMGVCTNL